MNGQGMKAGVIGAGAWGTALAQLLAADGQAVTLWALETDVVDAINRRAVGSRSGTSVSTTTACNPGVFRSCSSLISLTS